MPQYSIWFGAAGAERSKGTVMIVWIAGIMVLLSVAVIAYIIVQQKVSLKLLCALQSTEERVTRKRMFSRARNSARNPGTSQLNPITPRNVAAQHGVLADGSAKTMHARGASPS